CAEHPLLRNRIYELWKSYSTPTELASELVRSRKRTEWHLHRIYRARNLIVHFGEDVDLAPQLLNHLHYYFSMTVTRVLHDLRTNTSWNVAHALAFWRNHFEYVISKLKEHPGHLIIRDLVPNPPGDLAATRIWSM